VLLRQMDDGSPLVIISGFHRGRAAVALGWSTIDAVVLPGLCWRDAFDLAVADHQRDGELGVMAQAQLLGMSQRLGLSTTDSAHRVLGISARRTRQVLQLLQLPGTLRCALDRGDVTVPQALLLARWWPLDDPQLHQWIEEVRQSRLSLMQLRAALAARGPQALTVAGAGRVADVHDPRIRRVLRRRLHAALHVLDRLDHATTIRPFAEPTLRDTDTPQAVD
jgi:ParB-like chromosome segregation protein Spo0J